MVVKSYIMNNLTVYMLIKLTILFSINLIVVNCRHAEPPRIIRQPTKSEQLFQVSKTFEEVDKPAVLECEATGNPEPKYRWIKNGVNFDYVAYDKRITQQPKRGTLIFTKPEDVDDGLYQCFAENIYGTSMSNSVFLRKAELNSFSSFGDPVEIIADEGKPLTLDCDPPTGYPKPVITWIIFIDHSNFRTINSSRLTVDPEGRLHFSNVTASDSFKDRTYTCSATSYIQNEFKLGKKFVLKTDTTGDHGARSHPLEKQYVSPPKVIALRGQKLELNCIYGGTPLPEVSWKKRGSKINTRRVTFVNFGKTLVIYEIDFEDGGTYECTVSNGVGNQQSHAMVVSVQAAPFWKIAPNHTNKAEGESVEFECLAGGEPDPKLQWFVNGKPLDKISSTSNPRRTIEGQYGNILKIRNLEKQDTAVYQCNASNIHGYAFKDFYINVLALPPSIIERPEQVTRAVITSTVTLKCRFFGAPKPEVVWSKNNVVLTGGKYEVLPEGDLRINDVQVGDRGKYVCLGRNRFNQVTVDGDLDVKMLTEITHSPENVEIYAGKMATFRCNAKADPSLDLEIIWSYEGKEIDFDQNQRIVKSADNSLTISKTKELDSGIYTCTAKTSLDSASANASLTVQQVPNPPKIKSVDCSKLVANINWESTGDGRAAILNYIMQYNTSFTPNRWDELFATVSAADNHLVGQLSPWVNYTFRVIAYNKVGPSPPSKISEMCSTEPDVPFKHPESVTGFGDQPGKLIINWAPMPQILHNAPGFFYKVYWKREDIPDAQYQIQIVDKWMQDKLVLNVNEIYKPYRIKVEAHNSKGQALTHATEVIGYSGEDVPILKVEHFKLIDILDDKTASFKWQKVNPTPDQIKGRFEGYRIQTWTPSEGEANLREFILTNAIEEATVSIFKPFSTNIVQIVIYNSRYNGPPSDRIEFKTPEGKPGPVKSLTATQMGSSALYLSWKKPDEPNGVLTGYKVTYQEVNGTYLGTDLERTPQLSSFQTGAKLGGLKPATKYRITIKALTLKGEGDPYYIETETRDEEDVEPDEPKFVYTRLPSDEQKSGIRVTWVPTLDGKPGSQFYAQYRRKGESAFDSTPKEENKETIEILGLESGVTYEVRIIAVDGKRQTPSKVVEIPVGPQSLSVMAESTDHLANPDWLIGMICAIALIIVLAILVCIVKRNRGGKYSVHEKEAAQGRELEYGDDGGFNEYSKPDSGIPANVGSRTSLTGSYRNPDENDTDSMTDYGEDDSSKFGEDGSFIGQYGSKKKAAGPQSPTGVATFV